MPIFDQGYQHWSGELSGNNWLAVTRHGIRVGLKGRVLRTVLLAAWVPALALVLVLCLWGLLERKSSMVSAFTQFVSSMQPGLAADPAHYRGDIWRLAYGYFLQFEMRYSMILILIVGPSLISQDLRFNALPLYFSRPLRRRDYFLGKLGVITAYLGMVVIAPSIVAYIFGLLFSLDLSIIGDTYGILLGSVGYGLIIAISGGMLILALSALSRNSRYVALLWVGIWFVSGIIGSALHSVQGEQRRYAYYNEMTVQQPAPPQPGESPVERTRKWHEWRQARQRAEVKYRMSELEFSRNDWRPLISYAANLSRLQQAILGTNQTWRRLSQLDPNPEARDRLLSNFAGPEFPWYWSAEVLLGLFGISAWILNSSIKSLDRLK